SANTSPGRARRSTITAIRAPGTGLPSTSVTAPATVIRGAGTGSFAPAFAGGGTGAGARTNSGAGGTSGGRGGWGGSRRATAAAVPTRPTSTATAAATFSRERTIPRSTAWATAAGAAA